MDDRVTKQNGETETVGDVDFSNNDINNRIYSKAMFTHSSLEFCMQNDVYLFTSKYCFEGGYPFRRVSR